MAGRDSESIYALIDDESFYEYLTRRTPEEQLEELSKATGVLTPFMLVFKEQFNDCVREEKMIHSILEERGERVSSNREFLIQKLTRQLQ